MYSLSNTIWSNFFLSSILDVATSNSSKLENVVMVNKAINAVKFHK